MAVVGEGDRRKLFLSPSGEQEVSARLIPPASTPETDLPEKALGFRVQAYGMVRHRDLFTARQLVLMEVLCDLVGEAQSLVAVDALEGGMSREASAQYARDVALFLALAVSRYADMSNALASWNVTNQNVRALFSRQAVPMAWDFVEANPFGAAGIDGPMGSVARSVRVVGPIPGTSVQADASFTPIAENTVVCTDPPYYANIGYADLSDFFYVWLRRALGDSYDPVLGTVLTPKSDELIATPFRFDGDWQRAERHFEEGFLRTFTHVRESCRTDYPMTVFYAYKQTEDDSSGSASTGWETMLSGLLSAGLMITATWPMRTERSERAVGLGANALASSIVLACRQRPDSAEAVSRRSFLTALKDELPKSLREMQQGSIAPVDLSQAAIGPGMAVFSRYARVTEADGSDMTVRTALALINQVLDEVLLEQEGDFDAETRFALKWFAQSGWNDGSYGDAETLAKATNTSVAGLQRGGIFSASAGRARLLEPSLMPEAWDPMEDKLISVWEVTVRIAYALSVDGVDRAAAWRAAASGRVDMNAVKELAYILFSVSEKMGWTESAILFNGLGTSWSDLSSGSSMAVRGALTQGELAFDGNE